MEESLQFIARFFAGLVGMLVLVAMVLLSSLKAQDAKFHNAPHSVKALKNPYQGQAPADAKTLYQSRCAVCHGENGEGTGNIPSLAKGRAQTATDGELFWYISKGDINNGMPSWQSLPEEERWKIVSHVKLLGSAKSTPPSTSSVAASKSVVDTNLPMPPAHPSRPWLTLVLTPRQRSLLASRVPSPRTGV